MAGVKLDHTCPPTLSTSHDGAGADFAHCTVAVFDWKLCPLDRTCVRTEPETALPHTLVPADASAGAGKRGSEKGAERGISHPLSQQTTDVVF